MSDITIFKSFDKTIRHKLIDKQLWVSAHDIIEFVIDRDRPRDVYYRLEKKHIQLARNSSRLKIKAKDGKERETIFLNETGIHFLLVNLGGESEKLDKYKEWVVKKLTPKPVLPYVSNNTWLLERDQSKLEHEMFANAVHERAHTSSQPAAILHANLMNAIYQCVIGKTAKEFRILHNLPKDAIVLDHLPEEDLLKVRRLYAMASALIDVNQPHGTSQLRDCVYKAHKSLENLSRRNLIGQPRNKLLTKN